MSPIIPPCSCRLWWINRSSLVPDFCLSQLKLVAQMVAGKYIDLSDLLAVNLVQRKPVPQLLFDGCLVLTSQPKKTVATHRGHCFVDGGLCNFFPHPGFSLPEPLERSHAVPVADPKDHHFSGRVWLAYHQAFHEHAAASQLTNWSSMNVQLFTSHSTGSSGHQIQALGRWTSLAYLSYIRTPAELLSQLSKQLSRSAAC